MTTDSGRVGGARTPRRRSGTVAPASRAMTAGISLAATASIVAALALSAQSPASGAPSTVELDVTSGARPGSAPVVDTGAATAVEPPPPVAVGSTSVAVPQATTSGTATTPATGATAPVTATPVTVAPTPDTPPPTSPPATTTPTTVRPTTTTTAPRTRAS